MDLKSLSATALHVFELCPARFNAEHIIKGKGMAGNAAAVGTAVHGGLENFVQMCYLKDEAEPTWELLFDLYRISYIETFNTADFDSPEFLDGSTMTRGWWERTSFDGVEVLSCEVKESFPIPTSIGEIPFNYIWDRADQLGETEYRVVDYKTIRARLNPDDLRRKIQPRAYALAAQIKWPHAQRIWVTYDLLRHEPVGRVFTREDNANFWKFLKSTAQRIVDTDDKNPPEILNAECKWCPRKVSCTALQANIRAGGMLNLSGDEIANRKLQISSQIAALSALDEELDTLLVKESEQREEFEWTTDTAKVEITASRRRNIDPRQAAEIIGPDLMKKYGGLTMGNFDTLQKGTEITEQQKAALRKLVYMKWGEPKAKVAPINPLEEE